VKLAATLVLAIAAGAAAPTVITDPEAFVREVYRHIEADPSGYPPPADIYTPRLAALFRADQLRHKEEVGCVDFDFWTNTQDPTGIRDIRIAGRPSKDPARKTVVATFMLGGPMEIHFQFRRAGSRWLLDEVSSHQGERWVLSQLLRCK